jgi:hypothetical protein
MGSDEDTDSRPDDVREWNIRKTVPRLIPRVQLRKEPEEILKEYETNKSTNDSDPEHELAEIVLEEVPVTGIPVITSSWVRHVIAVAKIKPRKVGLKHLTPRHTD